MQNMVETTGANNVLDELLETQMEAEESVSKVSVPCAVPFSYTYTSDPTYRDI